MNNIDFPFSNVIVFVLTLLNSLSAVAQISNTRLCVVFDKDSHAIEITHDVDSTKFGFNIIKEGFETEEAREEAKRKALNVYEKNKLIPYQHPQIYLTYTALRKPTKFNSIEKFMSCKGLVDIDAFRKQDFNPPKDTSSAQIYLVERRDSKEILVWASSYFE